MKYRFLAILLALAMVSVFASCGKKTVDVPKTEAVTTPEGETVTGKDGAPVTQVVTEAVTTPEGETVTGKDGAPVTQVVTEAATQPDAPESDAPGEDAPPPEDAPIVGGPEEDATAQLPEASVTPLDTFNHALLEGFTDEEMCSQWFSAYGLEGANGVEAYVTMAQESDDTDAFSVASRYYAAAKSAADNAGVQLASYEFTMLRDGVTVGVYSTTDGVTYNATVNGETTTMKAG